MIEARQIYKSYGSVDVLKGVDLSVQNGEVVSIVGASGAGKTTLLQILGTLDRPQPLPESQLQINNREIAGLNEKNLSKFRNQNIGFIFQFHQLLPEFTAVENVCIPGFIAKREKQAVEKRAKEILDFLGLDHRFDHKPGQMSGGEQQRTAVARALINDPGLILADEPSGNLDSESAENLHQLFFTLREEFNQTFVIVTHNKELAAMADRKLTMVDGKIIN
ncbi:MAG: ABC transporter ATP-binding protein [Leeuwenhoekiella sp.]